MWISGDALKSASFTPVKALKKEFSGIITGFSSVLSSLESPCSSDGGSVGVITVLVTHLKSSVLDGNEGTRRFIVPLIHVFSLERGDDVD